MAKASKPGQKPAITLTGETHARVAAVSKRTVHENGTGPATVTVDNNGQSNFDAGHWLGITGAASKKINTYFDFIKLSNTGITKASINKLADYIGISRKYISENIFDVSVKTMERKEDSEKLSRKISSHALEIAKLMQHGYTVFRDEVKLKRWLNRENQALNNMKPVELLDTLSGLMLVDDVLGRIEEGVYA
jgi:putative toxin-antitoxin system antitoxin component (TIGR02293 family)